LFVSAFKTSLGNYAPVGLKFWTGALNQLKHPTLAWRKKEKCVFRNAIHDLFAAT